MTAQTKASPADLEAAQRLIDEDAARRRQAEAAARQAELEAKIDELGPITRWSFDVARAPRDSGIHERVTEAWQRFVAAIGQGSWEAQRDAYVAYSERRVDAASEAHRRDWAVHHLHSVGLSPDGRPAGSLNPPPPARIPYFTGGDVGGVFTGAWESYSEAVDRAMDELVPHTWETLLDRTARSQEDDR